MIFSLVLIIAVTIGAVFFVSFNHTMTHVDLFGYSVDGEVGLFIIIAVIVGVLVTVGVIVSVGVGVSVGVLSRPAPAAASRGRSPGTLT